MFEVLEGWVARGFVFEVETTSPEQPGQVAQAFGARRYAYNWALGQVKANLDARTADPTVPPLAWNFYELRKAWNQAKHEVAPWWRCTSKEAYASGIADLVTGLHNWSDAKAGRRKGARVGFPRFKTRHRDRGRVRFTTGAMRLEPDRRHLTVPVIGKLRSKENTRRLERLVVNGRARILSMTLSQRGGRLVVAVQAIVAQQPRHPAEPEGRCGVDLGIGLEWAVIAHHDGTVERVAHPAPWKGGPPAAAPPGPASLPPHRRIPSPPARENQACGAGPAGGEPPPPGHPRLDNSAGAPLRDSGGRGPRRGRDAAEHGPTGVPPHRQPGRHRPGPPDARLQVPGAGRQAGPR
jgi:hypothetical protein